MTRNLTTASASAMACLVALALLGSTGADATIYKVGLIGSFTYDLSGPVPGPLDPPVPFLGSFDVDTSVAPIQHLSLGGYNVTGYPEAAISDVSIAAFGISFSAADIQVGPIVAGVPGSAVWFSEDLYLGATPAIWMSFANGPAYLGVGQGYCGGLGVPSCGILDYLTFDPGPPASAMTIGTVSASVVPEPSTWAMMGLGFAALGCAAYRQRRAALALA